MVIMETFDFDRYLKAIEKYKVYLFLLNLFQENMLCLIMYDKTEQSKINHEEISVMRSVY